MKIEAQVHRISSQLWTCVYVCFVMAENNITIHNFLLTMHFFFRSLKKNTFVGLFFLQIRHPLQTPQRRRLSKRNKQQNNDRIKSIGHNKLCITETFKKPTWILLAIKFSLWLISYNSKKTSSAESMKYGPQQGR